MLGLLRQTIVAQIISKKNMPTQKAANAHMRYYQIKILKNHDSDNFTFNLFILIILLFMKSEHRMTTVNELYN